MLVQPPAHLPVGHLSASSVALYLKCPIRWKRRYIDLEYEPSTPAMLLGRAVGGAERDHFGQLLEGKDGLGVDEVLDAYRDHWQLAVDEQGDNVVWDEKPARVLDSGRQVLPVYHRLVAPTVAPIAIEREFTLRFPGVEWTFIGYIDVEETDRLPDLKARKRSRGPVSVAEAASEIQATSYLAARRAEGNPAREFVYHWLVRPAKGEPATPRDVGITPTTRTEAELDQFLQLLFRVAAEIQWRVHYDVWTPPPPGAWWCAPGWCGYWSSCEFGGKLRAATTRVLRPGPARRLPDADVYAAIDSTVLRTGPMAGTTTAAKVGRALGISTRAAAARLRALPDVDAEQPVKASGRGKDRVVTTLPGPKAYRRQLAEVV